MAFKVGDRVLVNNGSHLYTPYRVVEVGEMCHKSGMRQIIKVDRPEVGGYDYHCGKWYYDDYFRLYTPPAKKYEIVRVVEAASEAEALKQAFDGSSTAFVAREIK